QAEILNEWAWLLVTRSDVPNRDPNRAVQLAKWAVEAAHQQGAYWNTLGVAHYRASDYKAAVRALEMSMGLRSGGDANDWFFLAMAHWREGNEFEARSWYDRAVAGMKRHPSNSKDLLRFRAEAMALLGLPDAAMPNGPAAFARP